MPFNAQQLSSMANAALDYFIKGQPLAQTIQDKPLLSAMRSAQKTFSGGAGLIRRNIKADYSTAMTGFENDDVLTFGNPGNIRQINFPWKELHAGIETTLTELKKDGISVVDSMTGARTVDHSEAEMHRISGIWQDKLDDLREGVERSMNSIFWRDGTQDSKAPPGVLAFISDTPTTGIIAGIDRAQSAWWRNRASLNINAATPANQTLTTTLRREVRQLRRYGGKPNKCLCGSAFLEALEAEVHNKGVYTQTGFTGRRDISMGSIVLQGVGEFEYDPTLDDLGRSKHAYIMDTTKLYPMVMDGEDMKKHVPARPHDQLVIYQGVTWTGAMVCTQMNAHGVYSIA
jgi:hypothetical protein